jgi:hypothetical protein
VFVFGRICHVGHLKRTKVVLREKAVIEAGISATHIERRK